MECWSLMAPGQRSSMAKTTEERSDDRRFPLGKHFALDPCQMLRTVTPEAV